MKLNLQGIEQMNRVERLKLINAISGIKAANLIGSRNEDGQENLAIFNSVVHLGSDPAMLGFILRPTGEVPRHTYENILVTGEFTINHVNSEIAQRAHYTSAKFPKEISEFKACGLTQLYIPEFSAPFVKESKIRIGMRYLQDYLLPNDTRMIVGKVEHLFISDYAFDDHGELDLNALDSIGTGGLNKYYKLQPLDRFPYARPEELPWD